MPKKEVFKKMFDEKFDIKIVRQEILQKREKRERFNINKTLKYCTPIFLVAFICGTLILNTKKSVLNPNRLNVSNGFININNINDIGTTKLDAEIKKLDRTELSNFSMLDDLDIPDDFNNSIYNAIYVKDNNNHITEEGMQAYSTTSPYNLLNNFELVYESTLNNRNITISFSNINKPLRDYSFGENSKISKINDIDLMIYKYENSYMTKFNYQNVNYDIETNNVSEEELINLLKSIIK